jgi:hypothetical protein
MKVKETIKSLTENQGYEIEVEIDTGGSHLFISQQDALSVNEDDDHVIILENSVQVLDLIEALQRLYKYMTPRLCEGTVELVRSFNSDNYPSPATCKDFGILDRGGASKEPGPRFFPKIWKAYKQGLREKLFTLEELDRAIGEGSELTKLVQRVDEDLVIKTAWD